MVKAGRIVWEMQQCGKSRKVGLRDATMWLKQEGKVKRCVNVVKAGRLG